jgi:hypothetical protein
MVVKITRGSDLLFFLSCEIRLGNISILLPTYLVISVSDVGEAWGNEIARKMAGNLSIRTCFQKHGRWCSIFSR